MRISYLSERLGMPRDQHWLLAVPPFLHQSSTECFDLENEDCQSTCIQALSELIPTAAPTARCELTLA